jgi:O-antigen/teichoic acid export membrane protein
VSFQDDLEALWELSVGGVTRGGLFLFIGLLIAAAIGYFYWFLISVFAGTVVVGIASSIDSLSAVVSGIAILGLPTGVQRFLGRDFSHKRIQSLNTYFWSCFTLTLILSVLAAIIVSLIAFFNLNIFVGFSQGMLIAVALIAFLGFSAILNALFASIIRTHYIAISYVIAGLTKLVLGTYLVQRGFGWLGATIGLISAYTATALLLLLFALRELRRLGTTKVNLSSRALTESLRASVVSWLPNVTTLLGQLLSIIAVFSFQGGFEAGTFFMAYAIFSLVYMLPSSFMTLLFPILSGISQGREEVAWKVLKFCLVLACPSAALLAVYAKFPLSLVSASYAVAAPTLSVLAISTIPFILVAAVFNLVYASGWYGTTLGIGLALNVPRVILYIILVPVLGGYGAALSFLIGALTGLCIAIPVARKAKFKVSLGRITVAIAAPSAAALLCFWIGLNLLFGILVVLVTSVLFYGRTGVVERSDLAEIARAFASDKTIEKMGQRLGWLLRIIYGE